MLTFTSSRSRGNSQWIQILGVVTAIFMLGASAEALTRGEKEIQRKLVPAGTKLNNASDSQILDATLAAIQNPQNAATLTSEIVKAAMKYIPQNAPVLVEAGLNKVKTSAPVNQKSSEAKAIVSSVMRRSLEGVPGELEKPFNAANRAAAITKAAVEAVKDLASTDTMFSATVKAAVKVGAEFKKGSSNGAAGAVTGAIAVAAGVSNDDLSSGGTPGDALVAVIIRTAAKAAPSRALEIAEASGYAFASAYRGTTDDASEITINAFLANNLNDIIAAINAGLPDKKEIKLATQIRDRVQAGISLAYNNIPTNGSAGVSGFAYVNGVLPDLTNVAGL